MYMLDEKETPEFSFWSSVRCIHIVKLYVPFAAFTMKVGWEKPEKLVTVCAQNARTRFQNRFVHTNEFKLYFSGEQQHTQLSKSL